MKYSYFHPLYEAKLAHFHNNLETRTFFDIGESRQKFSSIALQQEKNVVDPNATCEDILMSAVKLYDNFWFRIMRVKEHFV